MINKEYLKEVGLSEREINTYLALLELGSTTTGPLIKKSRVPSSKIYQTLDKLANKGLVKHIIISKTKYFQASDPNNLIDFIEEKKKNIIEIIPELKHKQVLSENPQEAEVYESIKGVKAAFNDILDSLKKEEEYVVFTLGQELGTEELKRFFKNFHKKRIEKRIKVKLIANKKIKAILSKYHIRKGMKIKYTKLNLPTGIFIYANKVMTVIWGENPTAFVITSKSNSDRYKEFFEEIWRLN